MDGLDEQHFRCTCTRHSISVSRFEDFNEVEIEFWLTADTGNQWYRFRRRIRDAWRLLVSGSIPVHGVMLEASQAEKMGRKLISLAEDVQSGDIK